MTNTTSSKCDYITINQNAKHYRDCTSSKHTPHVFETKRNANTFWFRDIVLKEAVSGRTVKRRIKEKAIPFKKKEG